MQAGLFFVTSFACDSLKFIRFSFLLNGEWFEDATNCSIYLSLNLPFYTNRTNSLHSTVLPDQAKPLHNHTDSPLKPPKVKSIKKKKPWCTILCDNTTFYQSFTGAQKRWFLYFVDFQLRPLKKIIITWNNFDHIVNTNIKLYTNSSISWTLFFVTFLHKMPRIQLNILRNVPL